MAEPSIRTSGPQQVAALLSSGVSPDAVWEPAELADILAHQLSAPVEFDLSTLPDDAARWIAPVLSAAEPPLRSILDLFTHPEPPLELLILTKEFAKSIVNHPDAPMPGEVGRVLYLAAIAVALVRYAERITELDDAALCQGNAWGLAQPWVCHSVKRILSSGSALLEASPNRG